MAPGSLSPCGSRVSHAHVSFSPLCLTHKVAADKNPVCSGLAWVMYLGDCTLSLHEESLPVDLFKNSCRFATVWAYHHLCTWSLPDGHLGCPQSSKRFLFQTQLCWCYYCDDSHSMASRFSEDGTPSPQGGPRVGSGLPPMPSQGPLLPTQSSDLQVFLQIFQHTVLHPAPGFVHAAPFAWTIPLPHPVRLLHPSHLREVSHGPHNWPGSVAIGPSDFASISYHHVFLLFGASDRCLYPPLEPKCPMIIPLLSHLFVPGVQPSPMEHQASS